MLRRTASLFALLLFTVYGAALAQVPACTTGNNHDRWQRKTRDAPAENVAPNATTVRDMIHWSIRAKTAGERKNNDAFGTRMAADGPRPRHNFIDATNIAVTGIEVTALTVDGIYTQRVLRNMPGAYEADPIARPFVERGWPGQIAGGALFISADVLLRYLLHRKEHHCLERWLPMILTTYGTVGAA